MENKNVFLVIFIILFIISSVIAISFYLKWSQYSDYGDIKLKLPVDSTIEAIIIASSSNDFEEFLSSDIDDYYVTPKLRGLEGEEYSVIFTGKYDDTSNERKYYFTISRSGEVKTQTDFRTERDEIQQS